MSTMRPAGRSAPPAARATPTTKGPTTMPKFPPEDERHAWLKAAPAPDDGRPRWLPPVDWSPAAERAAAAETRTALMLAEAEARARCEDSRRDPDADAWRTINAGLKAKALSVVDAAFTWIDDELDSGGRAGGVAIVVAMAELAQDGRNLGRVIADIIAQSGGCDLTGWGGIPGMFTGERDGLAP